MFPEAALAGRDPLTERRRRTLKAAVAAGGGALVLLLSIGWLVGYLHNVHLINLLGERAARLQHDLATGPQGDVSDSDVTAVLPILDEARGLPFATTAARGLADPGLSFGLNRTRALRPQVDGAYRNLLNHLMLPRLILSVEDRLRALVQSSQPGAEGATDNRSEIYGLLRIYLMLGRSARRAPGAWPDRELVRQCLVRSLPWPGGRRPPRRPFRPSGDAALRSACPAGAGRPAHRLRPR